ncbi:hypothetical protein MMC22_003578 [Lobaria immixta]|nr:hypothetical protein [Lobaria immixta]
MVGFEAAVLPLAAAKEDDCAPTYGLLRRFSKYKPEFCGLHRPQQSYAVPNVDENQDIGSRNHGAALCQVGHPRYPSQGVIISVCTGRDEQPVESHYQIQPPDDSIRPHIDEDAPEASSVAADDKRASSEAIRPVAAIQTGPDIHTREDDGHTRSMRADVHV